MVRGRTLSVFDSTATVGTLVHIVRADSVLDAVGADRDGRFALGPVQDGSYVLRVSHVGFETTETPVTVAGSPVTLDVYVGRIVPEDELLFGAADAHRDIQSGRVKLLEFSVVDMTHFYVPDSCYSAVRSLYDEKTTAIERSYGFSTVDVTDEYEQEDWFLVAASVDRYNKEVTEHLSLRNGAGWIDRISDDFNDARWSAAAEGCSG